MFITKNRFSMQIVSQIIAMVLVVLLLVSCGGKAPAGGDKAVDQEKPEEAVDQEKPNEAIEPDEQQDADPDGQEETEPEQTQDVDSDTSGSPANAAESFGAYIQAKGEMVTRLSDALSNNPGTELYSMNLLSVILLDIALMPASGFGLGQEAASLALGFLGAEDIEYSENENQYIVKYRNEKGEQFELQGVYDKAVDSLKCTSLKDGKESLSSEYRKTSYGYVSQFYSINDDGSTYLYQLTVSGKDGVLGISEASAAPSELTGSEALDFPKQCQEWYAIEGDDVTGVTSDGNEISFVYTPSED